MLRFTWVAVGLAMGCSDDGGVEYTTGLGGDGAVHVGADGRFHRTPSDAATDAAPEGETDAGAMGDQGVSGDSGPAPADAAAADSLPPDAAPTPNCDSDGDCTLAVVLDACDPCPVPLTVEEVGDTPCTVVYESDPFSTLQPADCRAACPADTPEVCADRVFPVRCEQGACVRAP